MHTLDLKQADLSSQDKGEDSTQLSVIPTEIDDTMTTQDVGSQFNYLVPSLRESIIILLY